MSQKTFNRMVLGLALLVFVLAVAFVPGGQVLRSTLINIVLIVVLACVYMVGPYLLGTALERFVRSRDDTANDSEYMPWVIQWVVAFCGGGVLMIVWAVVVLPLVAAIPYWANTSWLGVIIGFPKTYETLPWVWGLFAGAFGAAGYLIGHGKVTGDI